MTRAPYFKGYATPPGAAVQACMFHDRLGLLRTPQAGRMQSTSWVARREGRRAVATTGARKPTEAEVAHGIDASAHEAVPFHEFARHLALVDAEVRSIGLDDLAVFRNCLHLHASANGGMPFDRLADDGFRELLETARADLARAREAIEPFVSTLSSEALALARSGDLTRADAGAYAMLDPSFDPGAPLARAWRMLPRLRRCSARMARTSPEAFGNAVQDGTDALRATLEADMASRAPPGHAARLVALARRAEGGMDDIARSPEHRGHRLEPRFTGTLDDTAVAAARLLCSLPPEWVPEGPAEWRAFGDCSAAVALAVRSSLPGRASRRLDLAGGWQAFRDRLTKAHGMDAWVPVAVRGFGDMVDAFRREVVEPAVALAGLPRMHAGPLAHDVARGDRGVRRMLELSARWHRDESAMTAALADPDRPGSAWPGCLPDAAYGEVRISEVLTAAGLTAEGARGRDASGQEGLGHCVGGHAEACAAGTCRILSLATPVGERMSTAEVRWTKGVPRIEQHLGRRNSEPPASAVAALASYMADVASGLLPSSVPVPVPGDHAVGVEACGYDWLRPGAWERARDTWSFLLPRPLRTADPATFSAYGTESGTSSDP